MKTWQQTDVDTTRGQALDGALDRALSNDRDSLVPSLGFTDSVMAAVMSQGPIPLCFPWKRALPGLIAALVALAGFAAAELWVLEQTPAPASPAGPDWMRMLAPILHRSLSPDTTWTLTAFLIPLVTLWLTRRLLFGR